MSVEARKSPQERLEEVLDSITPEDLERIGRNLNDPNYAPEPVQWLDDSDPLGRNWDWLGDKKPSPDAE